MSVRDALFERVQEAGAEAFLVSAPANIRYLSGFSSPEDGVVVLLPERTILITDGRYLAQADEESTVEVVIARPWQEWLAATLQGVRLAVEADHMTLATYGQLSQELGHCPVRVSGLVEGHRLIKYEVEIAHLRRAAEITDAAFDHILEVIRPGIQEVEISLELERYMRLCGADSSSFDLIVASGPRSAMPHGRASQRVLRTGELITLDFGAVVSGYHADMTRTLALGKISAQHTALYDAVLTTQTEAIASVVPGARGAELDRLARDRLAEQGLAEYFAHSLGHGVGLQIHEGPRLSQRFDDLLMPGMVITIEPGVYIPGDVGVRIEDLLVVTQEGAEVLSKSEKGLIQL